MLLAPKHTESFLEAIYNTLVSSNHCCVHVDVWQFVSMRGRNKNISALSFHSHSSCHSKQQAWALLFPLLQFNQYLTRTCRLNTTLLTADSIQGEDVNIFKAN